MSTDLYAPFQACFRPDPLPVGAYLVLLNINDPAQGAAALAQVREAMTQPGWERTVRDILDKEQGWRPHLIAAAALLLIEDPLPFRDALYRAIHRGSWVVPQLLVTAWAIDPDFWQRAEARREAGFGPVIAPGVPKRYWPKERKGNPKELVATLGLAALDPAGADWALRAQADEVCTQLRVQDLDESDKIVIDWRERMARSLHLAGAAHTKLESV